MKGTRYFNICGCYTFLLNVYSLKIPRNFTTVMFYHENSMLQSGIQGEGGWDDKELQNNFVVVWSKTQFVITPSPPSLNLKPDLC